MTALDWSYDDFDRRYEDGVDRGVLYLDGVPGVAWKGLIAIDESKVGGERNSYYFDAVKYAEFVSGRNYQAAVEAYTAPKSFSVCLGRPTPHPGLYLTRQPRKRFNFSYRSLISETGYKIHLVYNVLATPTKSSYESLNPSTKPTIFGWKFDAVPPVAVGYKPSAHLIIDSTKTNPLKLKLLEDILYGTMFTDPEMPSQLDVISLIRHDVISEPLGQLI